MKRLTVRGTALTLVVFADVTFLLCAAWGAVFPNFHARWGVVFESLIPGFVWLPPLSVLFGLVWATVVGLYTAALFVPLFNSFEAGRRGEQATLSSASPAAAPGRRSQ